MMGSQVFVPPTQVHATTTITRQDCLWVRDAGGRESAWNFTNAALQARPGHVVSSVGRRLRDGSTEFLLADNHTTGQMDTFVGLSNAHKSRRLLAWLATTVVGATGILFALYRLITSDGTSLDPRAMLLPSNWTYPLIIAGFIAAILVSISARLIRLLRNRTFRRRYLPAFRQFFEQNREALLRPFA